MTPTERNWRNAAATLDAMGAVGGCIVLGLVIALCIIAVLS